MRLATILEKKRAVANKFETVIKCMTYGVLLQLARTDPALRGFSVLVLDEVHEDAKELYLIFGIVKKAMKMNKDLKVFMMSAKVDTDRICSFFENCDVIEV
ncbi:hypothetical protein BC829DRAFT_364369 [Chytridium lagenaria]|nr:hypothetical protein BC829DRAFT_364369 [Chytridium lagenaria]